MNLFHNRPLCMASFFMLLTGLLCLLLPLMGKIIFAALLLFASLVLIVISRRHAFVAAVCICLVCLVTVGGSLLTFHLPSLLLSPYDGQTVTLSATVTEVMTTGDGYATYAVKTQTIDESNTSVRLSVFHVTEDPFTVGDRFEMTATVTTYPLTSYSDYSYDFARGIVGEAEPQSSLTLTGHTVSVTSLANHLRTRVSDFITDHYSEDASALICAMLLGDRTHLSSFTTYQFRRAGISHLLALSGMHIAVLCLAIQKLCSLFHIPKRAGSIIMLLFILCYTFFTGLSLSIVRAAIMTGVVMLGNLLRREHDSITSLFFAAALITTVTPQAFFDLGFWMSVCATFGILLKTEAEQRIRNARMSDIDPADDRITPATHPRIFRLLRIIRNFLIAPLLVSISATCMTLPISCFFFGSFSLMFLPSNLIFPALMTAFLYLTLVSLPLPFLRPLTNLAASGYLWLVGKVASIPNVLMSLDDTLLKVLMILFVVTLLFFLLLPLRRKRWWVIALSVLVISMTTVAVVNRVYTACDKSMCYFQDGNNGDYLLLHSQGKTVLCDISSGSYSSFKTAVSEVNDLGEYEIDLLYLPHYTADFSASVDRIVGIVRIGQIIVPAPATTYESSCYLTLASACQKYGITLSTIPDTHQMECGDITITALPRYANYNEDEAKGNAAFLASVGQTDAYYFSAGYTATNCFTPGEEPFTTEPQILIFGRYGTADDRESNPVYPLTDATDTILMCVPDLPILLTAEGQEIYYSIEVERAPLRWYTKCKT